jgi:hypothetical protein
MTRRTLKDLSTIAHPHATTVQAIPMPPQLRPRVGSASSQDLRQLYTGTHQIGARPPNLQANCTSSARPGHPASSPHDASQARISGAQGDGGVTRRGLGQPVSPKGTRAHLAWRPQFGEIPAASGTDEALYRTTASDHELDADRRLRITASVAWSPLTGQCPIAALRSAVRLRPVSPALPICVGSGS